MYDDDELSSPEAMDITPTANKMNIVLFITTHLSEQHIRYLDCCWPRLMKKSKLLPKIDVMIYTNNDIQLYDTNVTGRITSLFSKNPNVRYKHDTTIHPPGFSGESTSDLKEIGQTLKQNGATIPMELGLREGWFSEYDWVIRINPDVLIRNSTWLMDAMMQMEGDKRIDGIFVDCNGNGKKLHTDFFAFRPNFDDVRPDGGDNNKTTAPYIPFSEMVGGNAERTATKFFQPILDSGRYKWLPDAENSNSSCRVRGMNSSVLHDHNSCRQKGGDLVCEGLKGWDIT